MKNYLLALLSIPMLIFSSEEEDFTNLQEMYTRKSWDKVVASSTSMLKNYPESIFTKEINFFKAVAYFHKDDPSLANYYLTQFLEKEGSSRYFEEALKYKYFIAEKFENGYYGHLFGVAALPRLESMWETAYLLYDEVIMTLPRSEVAAKALFRRSCMYCVDGNFEESIEGFTNLIRRFSNNTLAQQSYIEILKVYKKQIKVEYLDPKCYEFALINKKRFDMAYPSSKLKIEMEEAVLEIIDLYAEDVYKSALYFEKKNNVESAVMYLKSLVAKYPTSKYAALAIQKVAAYDLDSIKNIENLKETSTLIGAE